VSAFASTRTLPSKKSIIGLDPNQGKDRLEGGTPGLVLVLTPLLEPHLTFFFLLNLDEI